MVETSEPRDTTPGWRWLNPLKVLRERRGEQPTPEHPEPVTARGSSLDVMVVIQFRPAWEIQAYLRFARLPYRVDNSRYMGSTSTGLYPALVDGQFVVPVQDAPEHVARRRKNLDANLTQEEKAEAQAFCLLVTEGLQPLLRVLRHRAPEGEVRQTVYPPMKKALLWPFSAWCPGEEGRQSEREASLRRFTVTQDGLVERARTLYSALDVRLGGKCAFFFGATPTALDACVFGHLAEAWTVGVLLDILPAFGNLSLFFRRVCEEYFRPGSSIPLCDGGLEGSDDNNGFSGDRGVAESKSARGGDRVGVRGGVGGGGGDGSAAVLREAMMRADYVNSQNAFNQLPGCALCAGAPYIGDPYPERPLANAGILPPVLAGGTLEAEEGTTEAEGMRSAWWSDDSLPLKFTGIGAIVWFVFSALGLA